MRGALAKDRVVEKLKETFGTDFIGEYQKKYYVWADDGTEKVQISIALTCPKTQLETVQVGDYDFTSDNTNTVLGATGFDPAAITPEEEERAENLMKKLGF